MATVHIRYLVDNVEAAIRFYTTHLGFSLLSSAAPAFADVTRGDPRLLLSGPRSSAGRPMSDGRRPSTEVEPNSFHPRRHRRGGRAPPRAASSRSAFNRPNHTAGERPNTQRSLLCKGDRRSHGAVRSDVRAT